MRCGTKDADHDYLTSIYVSCFDTASKQRLPQSWNEPCRIHVMYCHAQPHLLFYGFVDLYKSHVIHMVVGRRRLYDDFGGFAPETPGTARLGIFFAARPRPCFIVFFGLWSRALSEVGMVFLGRWSPQLNLSLHLKCWFFQTCCEPRGFLKT